MDYISYCENKAFGSGVHAAIRKNSQYKKNILSALNEISKTLSIDVKNAKILAEAENHKRIDEIRKQQTFEEMLTKIAELPEGEMQEYTTAENQARIASAVEQLEKFKINTPLKSPKETFFPDDEEDEEIILGSRILTVEETRVLSDNIDRINNILVTLGSGAIVTKLISPKWFSYLVTGAITCSQHSIDNDDIEEAARHGYRIKMTIFDSKNKHSSYSVRISYEIIKDDEE